ncbi:MAG: WecB/TagA/CpsF family glycosyltransferase [Chloroflexi bacterium]|nr:WecB/TagA/CpsF family glycosyltransferase [Chloroflexota bacterium]
MEKFRFLDAQRKRETVDIMGLPVNNLTLESAVATIEDWSARKRQDPALPGRRIVTANPEYVMTARRDPELMRLIQEADMVTPDGVGLTVAAKLFGTPLQGRVTGVELSLALARRSARTGLRLFLLGAAPGIAEAAAANLRQQFPGICIAGIFSGDASPAGDAETLRRVRDSHADVVLVAYGMGKQDRWAVRNLDLSGAAVSIGVGGTFDYLSGQVPMAPYLVRRLGMEWLFRLITQPWRWKRDIAMLRFGTRAVLLSFVKPFTRKKQPAVVPPTEFEGVQSLPGGDNRKQLA